MFWPRDACVSASLEHSLLAVPDPRDIRISIHDFFAVQKVERQRQQTSRQEDSVQLADLLLQRRRNHHRLTP